MATSRPHRAHRASLRARRSAAPARSAATCCRGWRHAGAGAGRGPLTINGNLSLAAARSSPSISAQANAVGQSAQRPGQCRRQSDPRRHDQRDADAGRQLRPASIGSINYGGALTNNGLAIGTMPAGAELFVQTAIANRSIWSIPARQTLNFWDGSAGPKIQRRDQWRQRRLAGRTGNDNWTE